MRGTMIGLLAASTAAVSGCGSSTTFVNKPRPATPVNVTVFPVPTLTVSKFAIPPVRFTASPPMIAPGERVRTVADVVPS